MGQGVLLQGRIRGPLWCDKFTKKLPILAYSGHIRCCVANIGGLACISMWLLMSGGVRFVTGSCLVLTPCHLSYNPCLSWDWATVGHWTLQGRWLLYHVAQNMCWWWWSILARRLSLLPYPKPCRVGHGLLFGSCVGTFWSTSWGVDGPREGVPWCFWGVVHIGPKFPPLISS